MSTISSPSTVVATDEALDGVSGRYYFQTGQAGSPPCVENAGVRRRLWRESARLVGLPEGVFQ